MSIPFLRKSANDRFLKLSEGAERLLEKQQAAQAELDAIWEQKAVSTLEARYNEVLEFFRDAGFLKVPIAEEVKEPLANLIHLLQTEVATGRVTSLDQARRCPRAEAEGYWHICDLVSLDVCGATSFRGTIKVKEGLGGEVVHFDGNTRAYEVANRKLIGAAQPGVAADEASPRS